MGPRNQGKLVEWGICLGLGEHGDLIDRGVSTVGPTYENGTSTGYTLNSQCIFRKKEAVKSAWELDATKE